jgi:hypothetical protein
MVLRPNLAARTDCHQTARNDRPPDTAVLPDVKFAAAEHAALNDGASLNRHILMAFNTPSAACGRNQIEDSAGRALSAIS